MFGIHFDRFFPLKKCFDFLDPAVISPAETDVHIICFTEH